MLTIFQNQVLIWLCLWNVTNRQPALHRPVLSSSGSVGARSLCVLSSSQLHPVPLAHALCCGRGPRGGIPEQLLIMALSSPWLTVTQPHERREDQQLGVRGVFRISDLCFVLKKFSFLKGKAFQYFCCKVIAP